VIENVKYRLLDSSGYYTHASEWEENLNRSDAALVLVTEDSVSDGLFFAREFFEVIGALIRPLSLPTYVVVNRAKKGAPLENLEGWMSELLPGVPSAYSSVPEFTDEIYLAFTWIQEAVAMRTKRRRAFRSLSPSF
jgi:hypothetical protein